MKEIDYDALAQSFTAAQAKSGIAATADLNPDAEAKNRQTARQVGAPVSAVRALPQEFGRREKIESIDYDALAREAPRTSAFIANPEDAAIASDDVEALSAAEKQFGVLRAPTAPQSSLGSVLRGLASGFGTGLELTRQGINQQFADLVGNAPYSREAQREAEAARFRQSLLDPQFDSSTGEALYGAGRSLLQLAPALAASTALRSPSIALGAAGLQTETDAYTKYRARGAAPSTALLAASGEGAVEVATEFLPMGFLAERLGKAGGTEFVKKYLLPDLAGEQAATLLQDAIDTGVANPDKTWGDFLAERPEAAYQTAVSSLALSGLFGGVNAAARRFSAKEEQASEAVQLGDAMEQIGATPSKLKERDPEAFKKFAETAAEGGQAQSVFLDRDGFAQSGIDPAALAEILPEKAEEIARALAGDGDVEISVADYAARVAGTDIGAALADHVRFDPLGLSRAEGREFMQSGAAEFDKEAETALAEAENEIAFETSRDKVRADIETRLNDLGRFGKDANAKYAQLTATVYGAWADRYGVSPEEFYAANPVDFYSEFADEAAVAKQARLDNLIAAIDEIEINALRGLETAKQQQLPFDQEAYSAITARIESKRALREAKKQAPKSLLSFVKEKGGVNPGALSGDFKAMGLTAKTRPGVLTAKGKQLDYMREAAAEAGYIAEDATIEDFIAAMGDELGGNPIYPISAAGIVADVQAAQEDIAELDRYLEQIGVEDQRAKLRELQRKINDNERALTAAARRAQKSQTEAKKLRRVAFAQEAQLKTDTPEFKAWFDLSAVYDEKNEKPLVVYHATDADISQFDMKRLAPKGKYGRDAEGKNARFTSKLGFWFSEKKNIASRTGNNATMPVFLSIQNPYTIHLEELFQERENYQGKPEDFINDLMDKGYDGLNVIDSEFGGTSWVAFRPEQIKSVFNRGTFDPNDPRILYQGDETQRGFFNPDRNLIGLLQNADYSTFLHESGHFYLETMARLAAQESAPQGIKDDMQKLLNWFGVPDLATWQGMDMEAQREHHEKFARGFEAYLFEGKAPSRELRSLFRTFAAWLKSVYKTMRRLNVELTDEVRGVMDRLLATEAQIKEAEAQRAFVPLFKNIDESQMMAEEFAAYTKLDGDATLQAAEELQRRSVADMKWLSNAKSRYIKELQKEAEGKRAAIREEVREEVEAQPIEQARRFIRKGEVAGVAEKAETHKINSGVLKELYGESDAAPWRALKGMTSPEGLHPDQLAEDFGYTSGDELIKELIAEPSAADKIARETDRRMMERYGGMPDAEALERAAEEAIHNKARARFLAREAAALEKATGKARLLNEAARAYAADKVAQTKIKDLKPARYEAQEARSGRKAQEAFRKGDTAAAAAEKRAQLLNSHVARESLAARQAVEKALKYFKRFDKRAILKRVDGEYVEQIRQLLERYDLRAATTLKAIERRKSFAAWYAGQVAEGKTPDVPDYLMDDARRQSFKELTVEELAGLVDTVKQVEHLGRLKNKLLTARDQRTYDEAVEAMTAEIAASGKGKRADNRTRAGKAASAKRLVSGFLMDHRKFANILRELDGWKDGGFFFDYIGRPANERGALEAEMRADATERLGAIVRPLLNLRGGFGGKGVYFESIGISLNREERFGIALNCGNAGNLQRLLDGEGWSMEQIRPVLDSLTEQEANAVQAIWDFMDSYRPLIGAKEKRVYGIEPEWVQPQAVTIGGVNLRGGYYPVKYDPLRNKKSKEMNDAQAAESIMEKSYTAATTRRTFTKARADEVHGRPLLYTMDGLFQGVNDVIHDLAWHEWAIDVNKFMRSNRLDSAIRDTYGAEYVEQMQKSIDDIITGEAPVAGYMERPLAHLRQGSVVSAMGLNITNAVINVTGLTQSFYRVGGRWMAKGIAEAAKDPRGLMEEIYEKSAFMRTREKTLNREVNEIRSLIRGKAKWRDVLERYMILPTYVTQTLVDAPTWKGAYLKALNDGFDESKAVAVADQAVKDAQGSGQVQDLAAIQRGSDFKKLLTAFYGYFSTTYNLSVEATKKTNFKDPYDVMRLAGDYLILYSLPAALGTILKAALTPGDDFEDPEELAKKLAADQLSYLMATMVGAREATGVAQKIVGLDSFDYTGPAGLRFFDELDKLATQFDQGELDRALIRMGLNTAGILYHLPSGQTNRTIDGVVAIMDGKTKNPLALVAGAPKP